MGSHLIKMYSQRIASALNDLNAKWAFKPVEFYSQHGHVLSNGLCLPHSAWVGKYKMLSAGSYLLHFHEKIYSYSCLLKTWYS